MGNLESANYKVYDLDKPVTLSDIIFFYPKSGDYVLLT